MKRLLTLIVGLFLAFLAAACGDSSGPAAPPPPPPAPTIAAVVVHPATTSMSSIGETVQLSATAKDASGQTVSGASFTWTSSSTAVATVNPQGLVTSTGNGEATITATVSGVSGSAEVEVEQAVVAVQVLPSDGLWITSGESQQATASAVDALGSPAPDASFTWASSDERIATVTGTGVVTAIGDGTASVTASAGGLEASVQVVVSTPMPVEACRLAGSNDEAYPWPFIAEWRPIVPQGTLHAVMLFVDYADSPATESTESLYDMYVPTSREWFDEASYGRAALEVTPIHTWYGLPRHSRFYQDDRRTLVEDAVAAADADVDFRGYDLIYVLSPVNSEVDGTPVWGNRPGEGVIADGHELRWGSTFGRDSRNGPWQVLVHETLHTTGLSDLYWVDEQNTFRFVGNWDIMSFAWSGVHMLAQHKFWLDWMPEGTIDCLGEGKFERVLNSFAEQGLDAAIVKLEPWLAYVVEARKRVGFDEGVCSEGVLIYEVDAEKDFERAVQVFPAIPPVSAFCEGHETFGVGEGEVSRFEDPAAGVTVEVMEEVGNGYRVRIVSGQ